MADTPQGTGSVQEAAQRFMGMLAPQEETESPEPQEDEVEEVEAEAETADVDDEDSDDEVEPEPQRFRVRVDNEEVEVSLDELLNGYSRTADYTRKTQKLSEERKAFEADKQEALQLRQQYAEVLPQLRSMVENALGPEPDWEKLRQENPEQAQWAWIQRQEAKAQLQQIREAEHAERATLMQEQQQRFQAWATEQRERVKQLVPDIADKQADIVRISQNEYGLTQQELGQLHDARFIQILHDAVQYRQSLSKVKKVKTEQSEIKNAGAGVKETVPNTKKKRVKEARAKLKKTGSVRDAADAFLAIRG